MEYAHAQPCTAASNYNQRHLIAVTAPFLTYLTVFKSRLGLANIVLGQSGLAHQSDQTLLRKIRQVCEETRGLTLGDPANNDVLEYLTGKRIISGSIRKKGRYRNVTLVRDSHEWRASNHQSKELETLPVFRTDIWMSHPDVASTIGAPTVENARETLELCHQLKLLSKAKNTWTASGQLVSALRMGFSSLLTDSSNPFLLGLEAVALLRQVVETDGLILRELLRDLNNSGGSETRDEIAQRFETIVSRAIAAAKELNLAPLTQREGRNFLFMIRDTIKKSQIKKRLAGSRLRKGTRGSDRATSGPGVLEHRVSPRLEWLTDLGYLAKDGLPKNSFEYRVMPATGVLLRDLDKHFGDENWADSVALAQWETNPQWSRLHPRTRTCDLSSSFRRAYRLLKRPIGPSPIRLVAFISGMICRESIGFDTALRELIYFAKVTDGVTLSGGRYRRSPENIYMTESAL